MRGEGNLLKALQGGEGDEREGRCRNMRQFCRFGDDETTLC